ncbi:MAG TPA: DNA-3-methyladenine glycosylase I [Gemmatimonadales bacterium]|nr:DNA-3-methyladenine glycosylase I [Gemmatimonadales bacterium]
MSVVRGGPDNKTRCAWLGDNPAMLAYHDEEWGVPLTGDKALFAKLILDGFQAGLSWAIILRKRDAFLRAFDRFDPDKMARYTAARRRRLLADPGIVRNRQKIDSAIGNARAYIEMRDAGIAFGPFLWDFVDGRPIQNRWTTLRRIPAKSKQSERMSKALIERGFHFVGPTICYAFMQAVGMVNDHITTCYRHRELKRLAR